MCLEHRGPNTFKINEIPSVAFRRKKYNRFVPALFINNPGLTGNCDTVRIPCYEFEAKINCIIEISCRRNNYDQDLVQRLFLKSLETGLTSETIMTEIKPLLRNPRVSDEDLIFAVCQASFSDQQRSVKLNKSKIRPRENAVEMEYEAENELTLIPRKQDSTKENKSVEMLDLLRSVKKELIDLRTDVKTLKKAKKEVRDHRGERKDKCMCKRCLENDEKVCTHCFKCCREGHIARKCPSSQGNRRGLRNGGKPQSTVMVNLNIAFIAKLEM